MPVPVILSDLSKSPLTPPAPEKPPIKVVLGTELLPILKREGGDDAVHPFARAVLHELSKSFPLDVVVVELGKEPKSFIGREETDAQRCPDHDRARYPLPQKWCDPCRGATALRGQVDDSQALAEKAVPIIMRVIGNPARYEWDGGSLATPKEAIAYMLDRCQRNADLGHLVGPGTQAYRLLCEAEAGLRRVRLSDVMETRGKSLATEPRRYLTSTEHQRLQEKRESKSHLEDEADEDAGGHDMTESA